jgi:hypothetical protein
VNLGTSYATKLIGGLEFTCAILATGQVAPWAQNCQR